MDQLSPVHEIVSALWRALHELGADVETGEIERWGFSIHGALSAPGREYHNHEHVMWLAREGDPLEVIAALYHDAVYIQVDQGPPPAMAAELATVLDEGWCVLPAAADDESTADVLAIFGRQVGDVVTPTTGLNEFASALVASIQLANALSREQRIAIAACIEQTIPFRVDPVSELRDRLVTPRARRHRARRGARARAPPRQPRRRELRRQRRRAVPRQHLEVAAGVEPGAARAARLHRARLSDRAAEDGALSHWLPAERVFHAYGNEPRPELHARRVARTTGNLELAVRYLRAKLYSIALVEAIAEITGGDVPLDFFMGGMKAVVRPDTTHGAKRIDQFLPHLGSVDALDPPLHRLLSEGRASESSFDTRPSPVGAFLHSTVGEAAMMDGVEKAKRWWAGASDADQFLASQPAQPITAICRAAAHIMDTRRDRLFALAERLER